jgi:lambda family phage tail tape measure protein
MIKTDWDYFEKSKLLEERTAMNKVMNDELQITKDLNDATRARGNYEITERQMIEATIEATQRQIKAETDRWNAMRLPKDADDWTAMNAQAQKIDELTEKMKNLNDQLAKTATPQTIVVALRKYADESADVWKQIGDAGTNAMKGLEDSLVDMCTTGTVSFQKMADAIIADIARICIKAGITGPLSKGLSNLMTFGNWSGTEDMDVLAGFMSAKGNIFQNGEIVRFRLGGIVNRPTFFPMKNGTGLMGEAGPEAVMPLSRTKDGRLGVTMPSGGDSGGSNVNIIYALDTKSFEDYLKRNPRPVINTIDQAIKDNSGLRNTIKRFTR